MPKLQSPSPVRRADARRNREKILAAARTAFADAQAEVSMAEVSRRAGVGMATLYRNYPSRQELLEALYVDEVDAICEAAGRVEEGSPGAVLTAWLHRFFAFFNNKHHIASELLKHTDTSNPVFEGSRARVLAAGQPLLDAARNAGEIRGELSLEQILDMVIAVAAIDGDPEYTQPILCAAFDGLRVGHDAQRA